jgi:hypothetical protein
MKIKLPVKKLQNLFSRIKQVLNSNQKSCRWIAGLLGKMTAMIPAIGEALLHIRFLQRDLAKNLRLQTQNWEALCPISLEARQELSWWMQFAMIKNGLPIKTKPVLEPALDIYVDASNSGWGVYSKRIETSGFWTAAEKEHSINVRELKTILFAIQLHSREFAGRQIRVFCDNTTALKYAKKSGGTASPILQQLALDLQVLLNQHSMKVQFEHIAGVKNVKADELSRVTKPICEWTLPQKWVKTIQDRWGPLTIDAFASRENTRLPR